MRTGVAAIVAVLMITAPAHAGVVEQVGAEAELARIYWAERGIAGCEDGFAIELYDQATVYAMEGGFCRVRVNVRRWSPDPRRAEAEMECALVFHEVRHALPGGTVGGLDGHGHTTGLMAPVVDADAIPSECVRWARVLEDGPHKGVARASDTRRRSRQ